MKTVRFGSTDLHLGSIGLGTWSHGGPATANGRPVGWFGTRDSAVRKTLVEAHRRQVRHWDTADVYGRGHSEQLIGEVWSEVPREDIFLASKVGWDPGQFEHYYHPEQMRRQLERSLFNLRLDHIDLYYLHHCDFGTQDEYLDDAVEAMRRFREEGKIRFIGLSDWSDERIVRYADRVQPQAVQAYRNVVDDTYAVSGLQDWVEAHDVGVAFFSPLKHGLLLGELEGPVTFGAGDHRNAIPEFRDFALLRRLRQCRHQLQQRFADYREPVLHGLVGALLADSPNACVLLGQRQPQQVRAAGRVGEPLTAEELTWVRQIYQENGRLQRRAWQQA